MTKKGKVILVTICCLIVAVIIAVCVYFSSNNSNVDAKVQENQSNSVEVSSNSPNTIDVPVNNIGDQDEEKDIKKDNIDNQIQDNKINEESSSTPSKPKNKSVIVIDPGHQKKANTEKEPIGPGATETKAKVTGGATGVSTGQTEYKLNLEVSLKLKEALESKGYTVIMTRTTNDVNLSNSERAKIANDANAAVFIRIHANSVDSSSVKGVLTMCQTAQNEFNGELAQESYKLSKAVLDNFVAATGAVNKGVTRTDTMSGINWCTVPTTIVEMGFLSNPDEDELMATEVYQNKMVDGIVKGIEEYLQK